MGMENFAEETNRAWKSAGTNNGGNGGGNWGLYSTLSPAGKKALIIFVVIVSVATCFGVWYLPKLINKGQVNNGQEKPQTLSGTYRCDFFYEVNWRIDCVFSGNNFTFKWEGRTMSQGTYGAYNNGGDPKIIFTKIEVEYNSAGVKIKDKSSDFSVPMNTEKTAFTLTSISAVTGLSGMPSSYQYQMTFQKVS
jgi:hypothetical protein